MNMNVMKRWMIALLAICLLVSGAAIPAVAEGEEVEPKKISQYLHNFDTVLVSGAFNGKTDGFGMSYANTYSYGVTGDNAISGNSLRVNRTDMRWWNVYYSGFSVGLSMKVKIDENMTNTTAYMCLMNHIPSTTTESGDGGRLIVVKLDADGNPGVYNYDGDKVATLERNRVYTLEAQAEYAVDHYAILIDGEVVSETNYFAERSPFYAVHGVRISVESGNNNSYITIDDVDAYAIQKPYPQPNSFQAPGKIPTVTLPDIPSVEGVAVYGNETMVSLPAATSGDALLLPLVETMQTLGAEAIVRADGSVTLKTEQASFTLSADGKTLSWNDETVTLNTPASLLEGVLYASGQVFAEVLNAKVWYSEALEMIVVTTGDYKDDNVLRSIGGTFWMNGQPYYELSYNKWDLSNQIASDPIYNNGEYINGSWCTPKTTLEGAELALQQLSEDGFKTIRVFCGQFNPDYNEETINNFWNYTDKMYDLCDQYGIRIVACLGLMGGGFLEGQYTDNGIWVPKTETFYDFLTDPECESRKNVNQFLEMYINRYKDRDTILMWEIVNEGNLGADVGSGTSATYSILQMGQFFTDMANEIRKHDDTRLITSGDSLMRQAQWNLFEGTMKGTGQNWTIDTAKERLKALWTINSGLDVVSIHGYGVGYPNASGHSYYTVEKGTRKYTELLTWTFMMDEARSIGMPLYNGECGGMIDDNGNEVGPANITKEAAEARERYLATLIDAGVQLTHWWAFRSDRVDFGLDYGTWNVSKEKTPETYAVILAANQELQRRYIVNPLDAENTHTLSEKTGDGAETWEETTVPEPVTTDGSVDNDKGCASVVGGSLVSIVLLGGLWLTIARKKND